MGSPLWRMCSAEDRLLLEQIRQATVEEDGVCSYSVEPVFELSGAVAGINCRNLYTGGIDVNLYAVRKAGKALESQGRRSIRNEFLTQYLRAAVHLLKTARESFPQTYLEGLAVCCCILQRERTGIVQLPVPEILQKNSGGRHPRMTDALFCESLAIRQISPVLLKKRPDAPERHGADVTEDAAARRWFQKQREIVLRAGLPEVIYLKKGIPAHAALHIARELKRLFESTPEKCEIYPVFHDADTDHGCPSLTNLLRKSLEGSGGAFWGELSLRLSGTEFWGAKEAAELDHRGRSALRTLSDEYKNRSLQYILNTEDIPSTVLTDNRAALERSLSALEQTMKQLSLSSETGRAHMFGFHT
ncbi:MAG: hypothetical protein Q4D81_03645 [Eubacteriales bacterium]|nr:hypothetical protein [Eubacteriales bacterium]